MTTRYCAILATVFELSGNLIDEAETDEEQAFGEYLADESAAMLATIEDTRGALFDTLFDRFL